MIHITRFAEHAQRIQPQAHALSFLGTRDALLWALDRAGPTSQ